MCCQSLDRCGSYLSHENKGGGQGEHLWVRPGAQTIPGGDMFTHIAQLGGREVLNLLITCYKLHNLGTRYMEIARLNELTIASTLV